MGSKVYYLVENEAADVSDSALTFSEKSKGAGYHRISHGLHTAVYSLSDFTGTVKLQGTLKLYPSDDDWFDIPESIYSDDSAFFVNANDSVNFVGNFVWLRAAYNIQDGTINSISYTF